MIDQVLIPCNLAAGMFPTEALVRIRDVHGASFTMFADRSVIVERDQSCFIRATRLGTDPETGVSVCLLPDELSENGSPWIRVFSAMLKAG
ncbi:MAG TPA: hypothetical protein VGC96_00985 [Candidatus Elarobacter sp.]